MVQRGGELAGWTESYITNVPRRGLAVKGTGRDIFVAFGDMGGTVAVFGVPILVRSVSVLWAAGIVLGCRLRGTVVAESTEI